MVSSRFIFQILLITFSLISYGQNEIGLFPTRNFSPEEYNALPQNWAIIEDNRGVVYIGNDDGLLEFDGTTWRKINTAENTLVRSLAVNKAGRVFVGSSNDFGYLSANSQGKIEYISLTPLLGNSNNEFGDIWKVFVIDEKVYFQSHKQIFCYTEDSVLTISAPDAFKNAFFINNTLFLTNKNKGIYTLNNDTVFLIKGSQTINDRIYALLPYQYNVMLGALNKKGIVLFDYQAEKNTIKLVKKSTEIDRFLMQNQLYNGIKLNSGDYSIGTFNGIAIINKTGDHKYWVNEQTGILDNKNHSQYQDDNQNLWLALSNGVSLVQLSSPITFMSKDYNINGIIESITRYKGNIYIATSSGVAKLNTPTNVEAFPAFIYNSKLKPVETWIVHTYSVNNEEVLLVEQNTSIKEISGKIIMEGIPWAIHQFEDSKNEFLIGVENGLVKIRRENGTWENEGKFLDIKSRITDIIEFDGNLWLSAEESGLFKVKDYNDKNQKLTFIADSVIEQNGPYIFEAFENKLLIGTGDGLCVYENEELRFYRKLNDLFGDESRYIHRMSVDYEGKLWLVTYINDDQQEVGFFDYDKDSNLFWNPTPFMGDIKGQINAIYHDPDGATWLGGSEGLYRYDSKSEKNYKQEFTCLIREVKLGSDSTLFYGTYYEANGNASLIQPDALKPVLDYKNNSLIFKYSAINIDVGHPTQYSYFLEGYDKKWSDWTTKTEKEYTNLPEGEYAFRVKAKTVYNHESREGVYQFEILPPWYRTWWAYILFVLAAIAVVYVIVTQYTKYLRAVIREKTAEIRQQKDEIEKKNDEITASIKYAERIQRAVVPTHQKANELLPEHFVLWRPRDIVSGDFWWMTEKNGLVIIVAADCTGHGVPGAFVSMLGVSFLNEIVGKMEDIQANEILNQLRAHVKTTMKQTGKEGESKDGMDLALIVFDFPNNKIQYAGAYNPLFLIREGELLETKATRNPIGIYIKEVPFVNHEIELQKGDTMYIFSDGFVDQFGGEKGGKFKTKKFKQLLLNIQDRPMHEQELILDETIDEWRGEFEQVDDIIVVGIRI